MKKIKLDLFELKAKEDLVKSYRLFKEITKKWFDKKNLPKKDYFKDINCILCNAKERELLFKLDNFSYQKCLKCDSIYTSPHPRESLLNDFYCNGEYEQYQDKLVYKSSRIRKDILEERKYKQIKKITKDRSVSILDVGCGNGSFLDICKKNGWKVEGVDPSANQKKMTDVKRSFKIHQASFSDINFSKKFDVISFWGVLEHLANPIQALEKAKSILKNNGIIVFEVPSADCFLRYYLEKYQFEATRYIESGRHNIFFSKKIIYKIINDFGFTIKDIESNGLDIQTILLDSFDSDTTKKIIDMQDVINDLMLGDHYRVFLSKGK